MQHRSHSSQGFIIDIDVPSTTHRIIVSTVGLHHVLLYGKGRSVAVSDRNKPDGSMKITPTIFGERHAPRMKGIAQDIGVGDCKITRIASEIAVGIIRNVFEMFLGGKEYFFNRTRPCTKRSVSYRKGRRL